MKDVQDLIKKTSECLKSVDVTGTSFLKPFHPACIFYFGKKAALFHPEMIGDISGGWGGNAEYLGFYTIEDTDTGEMTDAKTGLPISVEDIRIQVTDLLSTQTVFKDMSRIAVYCLLDTTEIKDADEFEKWYMMIKRVEEILGVTVLSMLMVILNESLQYSNQAKTIKNRIRDIYLDESKGGKNSHMYNSVFVIGNRLRNGSFIKIDASQASYADFNLFADLVLLSDTDDVDITIRRRFLFESRKPAVTAAYGIVQKPMAEIVLIAIKQIINVVREQFSATEVDEAALMKTLRISNNGRSEMHDRIYKEIAERVPDNGFLAYMPGKVTPDKNYDEFNAGTYGCLQQFVENNHIVAAEDTLRMRLDSVTKEFYGWISKDLNAAQLSDGIPGTTVSGALGKAEIAINSAENMPVQAVIEMKIRRAAAVALRKAAENAIGKATVQAKNCVDCFRRLSKEVEMLSSVGEEGMNRNLSSFYGAKLERYFSDASKRQRLLNSMLAINNDREAMLGIIYDELKKIFDSDPAFRLPFSQEITTRLSAIDTDKHAQEFIGQELIKDLNSKVSFFSKATYEERVLETYMLNTDERQNNLLFKYLGERELENEVSRSFFNTSNNDMVETLWFYYCTCDNLSL